MCPKDSRKFLICCSFLEIYNEAGVPAQEHPTGVGFARSSTTSWFRAGRTPPKQASRFTRSVHFSFHKASRFGRAKASASTSRCLEGGRVEVRVQIWQGLARDRGGHFRQSPEAHRPGRGCDELIFLCQLAFRLRAPGHSRHSNECNE